MFKLLAKLPRSIAVAVSGGVDSMVALHFLKQKHDVTVLHYVHNSEYSGTELNFVQNYCNEHCLDIRIKYQTEEKEKSQSKEEYWRAGRLEFFKECELPVITGATLDDAVEWYIFSALHGLGKYMEVKNENVLKPFLGTTKHELVKYAIKNSVPWITDPSNSNPEAASRNRIRNVILPELLKVNPGLFKVVKKRIIEKTKNV